MRNLCLSLAKAGVLLALVSLAPWHHLLARASQFLTLGQYRQAIAFLAVAAVCVIAFAVTPFLGRAAMRLPLLALTLGAYATGEIFRSATGHDLDADQVAMLWRERNLAGSALGAYSAAVLPTAVWLIAVAAVLAWPPARSLRLRSYWAVLPLAAFAACLAVVKSTSMGTTEFPLSFGVPAIMTLAVADGHYSGPREDVPDGPAPHPQYRNVVMIVDESIRGDYLQINNPERTSTPYLATLGDRLVNFGSAVSAHNCSAAARIVLRTGLQPADLPDTTERAFKAPTIWQYAKKAGFSTILVDGFAAVSDMHSYMTRVEQAFVDRTISVDDQPAYMRDRKIAGTILPELLADNGPQFIYVNKYGAHFPYRMKYPPDFGSEGGPAPRDNLENRGELIESYRRAVRWSVDEFFRTLLGKIDLKDTLIIYTSDHGQSVLDGGYKQSHCSTSRVHPGEGIVPLFALGDESPMRRQLAQQALASFGKATHFDIFPTLLIAMGYDEAWVSQRYDASLVRLPPLRHRRFLTGEMFGRGFQTGVWVPVD